MAKSRVKSPSDARQSFFICIVFVFPCNIPWKCSYKLFKPTYNHCTFNTDDGVGNAETCLKINRQG